MKEIKTVKMRVTDAITFCQLIDEYGEFHEAFMNFLSKEKNPSKALLTLRNLSLGERCYASRRIKLFYNTYKKIIDTIEQNSGIQPFSFSNYNYCYDSEEVKFKSNEFYLYLLANIDKADRILAVLERIQALGFKELDLNENMDFSHQIYKADISGFCTGSRYYLDNLEATPEYNPGIVRYKTNGSNYKMELYVSSRYEYISRERIILNSLTFDVDRLPKELSGQFIYDEFVGLITKKQQEYTAIRNSVDLSIGLQELRNLINRFNETVTKMESVDDKEQMLEQLRNMQQNLNQIQTLSSAYNQSIIEDSSYITHELLQEEEKKYVRRRKAEEIDLC